MAKYKENIDEKLGLSWLGSSGGTAAEPGSTAGQPASGAANSQPDVARVVVGKQILNVLKSSPEKTGLVYGLVDRLQLDISTVLAVVDWLESAGLVAVARDNYGNHSLRLTDAGEAWVS